MKPLLKRLLLIVMYPLVKGLEEQPNNSEPVDYLYHDLYGPLESMNDFNQTVIGPPFWLSVYHSILYYVLSSIAVVGCALNTYVFYQVRKTLKAQPTLNPAFTMIAMCASDIFCLLFLLTYMLFGESVFLSPTLSGAVKSAFCKTVIYGIHLTSAFSVWCWMVLSTIRYFAIFCPIFYRSNRWLQRPTVILCALFLCCAILETWIPIFTIYGKRTVDCSEDVLLVSPPFMQSLHTFELALTFFVPASLIIFMDITILFKKSPNHVRRYSSTVLKRDMSNGTFSRSKCSSVQSGSVCQRSLISRFGSYYRNQRDNRMTSCRMLHCYLMLTSIDLFLNMPHAIVRLLNNYQLMPHSMSDIVINILPGVAYIMYYSQYSINVLYVWILMRQGPKRQTVERKIGRCYSRNPMFDDHSEIIRKPSTVTRFCSFREHKAEREPDSQYLSACPSGIRNRSNTYHGRDSKAKSNDTLNTPHL